ncbi:MAG: hypothetical protein WBV97_01460, partial [Candidatus Sulfotelmatobacter sp.]
IDEAQCYDARVCDEVVNSGLIEIATGLKLVFATFQRRRRDQALQSKAYGRGAKDEYHNSES